jgi:hypothetical protein
MVPITALAGADPLRAMYAVRLANVPLLAIMAGLTWALAAQWAREGRGPPPGAALLCGAIPVVASSCARVTNDGLTAVLGRHASTRATLRTPRDPTYRRTSAG